MKVSAWLPPFLARRLAGRDTLQRSIDNAFWLAVEQVVRLGLALVTGIWVARYLGPEQYGWFSYAVAVTATVTALTSLGLNAVVVREIIRQPKDAGSWLGAALFLKAAGAAAGFGICLVVAANTPGSALARSLIVIIASGMFFQAFDIVDLVFQADGVARWSGWIRLAASLVANGFKIGLLLAGASVFWVAASSVLELALGAVGWIWMAGRQGRRWSHLTWRADRIRQLLRESWPLALIGLSVSAQAYFDQLVIGRMLGAAALGQYAAAMRLVMAFSFLPMIAHTVAAPEITRAHRDDRALYHRRLFDLYRLMGGLFLVTAVPLVLVGTVAAHLVLGVAYVEAAALLPWLAYRIFFTNLGVARSVFITNEGLQRYGLLTAALGATVNIGLNLWWVPAYGIRGAVAASMVSFALTNFALEAFYPPARFNFRLMLHAVFLPWRPMPGRNPG